MTCGACGGVADDWIWDEQDQEWENNFEWWHNRDQGCTYLCSRLCWLRSEGYVWRDGRWCKGEPQARAPQAPGPALPPLPGPC